MVACSYASPIFEPAEHSLDTVAPFVTAFVILDGLLARLAVRNTGLCALVYKGFSETVSVVSSISEEELCLNLGDAHHQAAWFSVSPVTSTPSLNLIPSMTFGNWFLPLSRNHFFDAA